MNPRLICYGCLFLLVGQISIFGQFTDYKLLPLTYTLVEPEQEWGMPVPCFMECGSNYLLGFRVDSIWQTDSSQIKYLNMDLIEKEYNLHVIGPGMLGYELEESEDGLSYLKIDSLNTFTINRALQLNDSAILYASGDSLFLYHKLISCKLESIREFTDSVKTYSLAWYDGDGNPFQTLYEYPDFKISKHYGLVRFPSFRDLIDMNRYPGNQFLLFSNELMGVESYFIRYRDIFNFQVGDVFHFRVNGEGWGPDNFNRSWVVEERVEYPGTDSICYTIRENSWGYKYTGSTGFDPIFEYTEVERILKPCYHHLDDYILAPDYAPMEPIILRDGDQIANLMMYQDQQIFNGRALLRSPGISEWKVEYDGREAYSGPFDTWAGRIDYFVVGCGSYHTDGYFETALFCFSCTDLVYFEKGSEKWGTPLVSISPLTAEKYLHVYPNPAKDLIQLETRNGYSSVFLFDLVGQLIRIYPESEGHNLSVAGVPAGIYILRVDLKDGTTAKRKILIQD